MSALAQFFEGDGLAASLVALVREHAVAMRPPRSLWVPFELGRPFGPPADSELQTRVLAAALHMLDRPGPGPLLEDFDGPSSRDGDPGWSPLPGLPGHDLLAEAAAVVTAWDELRRRKARSTVGLSGLGPLQAVEFVARFDDENPMPNPDGMARVNRARFAVDDIKACYLEAATAGGGRPSSRQLHDWLWGETLAGKMIRDFQDRARDSDDANLRGIAASLVPAERTLSFQRGTP